MSNAIANIADQLTATAAPAEKKAKAKKPAAKAKPAAKQDVVSPVAIVESLGVDTSGSKSRAINVVGQYISESDNKLAAANNIIKGLGGNEQSTELAADIVAKCMVERVVEQGAAFDAENAKQYADKKLERLMKKMPELQTAEAAQPATTASGRANKNNNEKKAKARIIFDSMKEGNSQSAIAKEIAAQLEITFANAFYYVNRVFK